MKEIYVKSVLFVISQLLIRKYEIIIGKCKI